MTWIWIIITIKILLLALGILLHIANQVQKRAQKADSDLRIVASAQAPVTTHDPPGAEQPHYGEPTLEPEWGKTAPARKPQKPAPGYGKPILKPDWTKKSKPYIKHPTRSQIRSLASQMASEANMELDGTRWIYRQVIDNGGIRRHTKDYLREEYKLSVPLHYRRKNGLPPDEMAMELGYDTEDELFQEIEKAERRRQSMTNNLPGNNYSVKDFLEDAEADLIEELNPQLTNIPL